MDGWIDYDVNIQVKWYVVELESMKENKIWVYERKALYIFPRISIYTHEGSFGCNRLIFCEASASSCPMQTTIASQLPTGWIRELAAGRNIEQSIQ